MDNVVTTIFNVESEAYQAFTELRNKPFGEGYLVAEAALVKRQNDVFTIVDQFDAAGVTVDDTASGMIIGSIVGILGGPMGVLLGASVGTIAGSMVDVADTVDSVSMLEATALKLYEDESAIIALVQEDEPAFDAAFEDFDVTIIRHFAADVIDEVDLAVELQAELLNEARQQLRAEKKAERKDKIDQHKADIAARFDAAKAKRAERRAEFREAVKDANDNIANAADEMLGR